ncbi:MAG: GGDEF domain-containing protein [Gammaproteobacteria bacterium]|nr:GGDEF domain-containing protein [Gammaproteobacteria bacterium]
MLPSHPHHISVQSDKLQLLYHQSFPAVFFSLIGAFIYTAIFWQLPNRDSLLIWLAAFFLSSLIRLVLFIRYRQIKPDNTAILKWETPYYITLMISSLIWGIGTVIICMEQSLLYQSITYFFLIGMAGAALSVYSAIRYFVISAIGAILLPATLLFLLQTNTTSIMMAIAGILFLLSALRATHVLSKTLHNSFMMTHQLTQANEKAEHLARTDMLTDLNNRRAFTELCKQQLQYCQRKLEPVSMLVLDLDLFKHVNDIHGHAAGDTALQHFSKLMKDAIRSSDICGRTGGEEFAILLPNTLLNEATEVAEKLRASIAENPVNTPERSFNITTSIGIASNHYGLETLLQMADQAMYRAKQSGRNQVICHENGQSFT